MDQPGNESECPAGERCPWPPKVIALRNQVDALKVQVGTDALTNLHNFHYFTEALEQELERSQRTGQSTALILLDLDHFKSVNDTYGHDIGNEVLQHTADILRASIRRLDIACRYGGEEFAIILPGTSLLTSLTVAERIRTTLKETPVITQSGKTLTVTASIGVAVFQQPFQDTAQSLIKRADEQLYRAKHKGRNQVCHAKTHRKDDTSSVNQNEKDALFHLFNDSDDE